MTKAIKEALVIGRFYADLRQQEATNMKAFSQAKRYEEHVSILDAALATFQPDGERREAIAPLRNRLADLIHQNYEPPPEGFPETEPWNGGALDIVDMIIEEILVSGYVQDESGIRADEREKCAKVAKDRAIKLRERAKSLKQPHNQHYFAQAIEASIIADHIRSARDGGAES